MLHGIYPSGVFFGGRWFVLDWIRDGLWNGVRMAWEVGWALVLGFLLSGIVRGLDPARANRAGALRPR